MQFLWAYTKTQIYKRLEPKYINEPLTVVEPDERQFDAVTDCFQYVTWEHTGKFVECSGCIVLQWRGTFDHERKASEQRYEQQRKIQEEPSNFGSSDWEPTNGGSDGPWQRVD